MTGITMVTPNVLTRFQGLPQGARAWKISVMATLRVFDWVVAEKASGYSRLFQVLMKLMTAMVARAGAATGIRMCRMICGRLAPPMMAAVCLNTHDRDNRPSNL